MKKHYAKWNEGGAKNIQVIVISGDGDENGFKASMEGAPWIALKFKEDAGQLETKVPCTGYPTPGVIRKDGNIVDADVFGKVEEGSLQTWLE